MYLRLLLLFSCWVISLVPGQGQIVDFCATPPEKSPWLIHYQERIARGEFPSLRSQETIWIPLAIHLVCEENGKGLMDGGILAESLCTLNKLFTQANIQFYIQDSLHRISRSDYYWLEDVASAVDMVQTYNIPQAVNTYFVGNALNACGFNLTQQGTSLGIVLGQDCMAPNTTNWAHELGHFLSLPHTFFGWEGTQHNYKLPAPVKIRNTEVELADGSNCAVAGDGFCDTKADYLNLRWYCGSESQSPIPMVDPTGQEFYADGSFIMGYAMDPCPTRFSPNQILAMRTYLTEELAPLFSKTPEYITQAPNTQILLVEPRDNSPEITAAGVTFRWNPVEHALYYQLELSPIPNFGFVSNAYTVYGTSFTAMDLLNNRRYYWRIRPVTTNSFCRNYSSVQSFTTSSTTAIAELVLPNWILSPNPVNAGTPLNVQWVNIQSNATPGYIAVFEASGRQVFSSQFVFSGYAQQWSLPTDGLSPGIYNLQIRSAQGQANRRFVITP